MHRLCLEFTSVGGLHSLSSQILWPLCTNSLLGFDIRLPVNQWQDNILHFTAPMSDFSINSISQSNCILLRGIQWLREVLHVIEPATFNNLSLLSYLSHALSTDIDLAIDFARLGGHVILRKKLMQPGASPEILDALGDTIGAASHHLPTTYAWPHRPTIPDVSGIWPTVFTFQGLAASAGPIQVAVRREHATRMTSQADVGFALWPAASILARWYIAAADAQAAGASCLPCVAPGVHMPSLADSACLELGAGMGLTGIVAAHIAKQVVLVDFNPTVLANADYNARLAHGADKSEPVDVAERLWSLVQGEAPMPDVPAACAAAAQGTPLPPGHDVQVRYLDWHANVPPACAACEHVDGHKATAGAPSEAQEHVSSEGWGRALSTADADDTCKFPVILGADMICCYEDAVGVAHTLQKWLPPHGAAILLLPPPRVRWGVAAFVRVAKAHGFQVTSHQIEPRFLGDDDTSEAGATIRSVPYNEDTRGVGGGSYEEQLVLHVVQWASGAASDA